MDYGILCRADVTTLQCILASFIPFYSQGEASMQASSRQS